MFETKDEADSRKNNARNLFSPTYVHPSRSSVERDAEHKEDEEEAGFIPIEGVGEDSRGEDSSGGVDISTSQIDSLISKAVDPYSIRRRQQNLQGQTDVQVAIGTSAIILGNSSAGDLYNLSKEQTRAYSGGLSSTKDITERKIVNEDRYKRIGKVREALAEKAALRLSSALESLNDDKIDGCSAPKLASIAKDMAVVMDKVTKDNTKAESVHFHLYRPEMKSIGDYTTVQLSSPIIVQPPGGGVDR